VDPHAGQLCPNQQLGVEEPVAVDNGWDQPARNVCSHGFESVSRIFEPHAQREPQQQLVAPRDQLALSAAGQARSAQEVAADRDLTVA
jgi:hypothetical protein